MKIRDIMCNQVFTCRADDALDTAARIMWEQDCGCVPVIDDGDSIVGMLTDRDVCMAAYTQGRRLDEIPVRSAMSCPARACAADDDLQAAEELMQEWQIRRVPVVEGGHTVIGIVSLNDIACAAMNGGNASVSDVSADEVTRTLGKVSQPRQTAAAKAPPTRARARQGAA